MTTKQATEIVARVFARYPGTAATVDELVVAEWVEEFQERFRGYPPEKILEYARDATRKMPGQYAPSLPQLCEAILERLRREEETRLRLVEPPPSPKEQARAKAFLREISARIGTKVRSGRSA